jgi:predicted short-subunit dehydrogenase-like oxidoreductase (DUF2520 family)
MRAAGVSVVGVHGRRATDAPLAVSAGPLPAALATATVVLVTVRDEQLVDALAELHGAALAPGAVVLHASGSLDPRPALDPLRGAGHPTGTFHPLVPLADPGRASGMLRGAWVGIDGDEAAMRVAETLAERLGAHVLTIPAAGRVAYHAAAVIASNFPTVLAALAARLMQQAGVEPSSARDAVRHLMAAAMTNLGSAAPLSALVGPVSRGDAETIARHLAALAGDPDLLSVYVALSRVALSLAAERGGVDPAALARIRDLLDVSSSR